MSEKKIKYISWPLIIFVLICGTLCYLHDGLNPSDAIYSAFSLFGFGVKLDSPNFGLRILRWLGPVSVATTVFIEVTPLFTWVKNRLAFWKSRTIIYSDTSFGKALQKNILENHINTIDLPQNAILLRGGEEFCYENRAKKIVIMMEQDENGLSIYRRLIATKSAADIFLCLNEMEPNLIPSYGKVRILNLYDLVAGALWTNELNLAKLVSEENIDSAFNDELSIGIMGFNSLGRRILYKGLLLNIISLNQRIVYHVLDENKEFIKTYEDILQSTMNQDEVVFYDNENDFEKVINDTDYLIIAEKMQPERLQRILLCTEKPTIYYYDPDGVELESMFGRTEKSSVSGGFERLHAFGNQRDIVKSKKIFNNKFSDRAADLNMWYLKRDYNRDDAAQKAECVKEWEKLEGFYKGANINAVDYAEVGLMLRSKKMYTDEELAELVHIHWCRYHLLNHWRLGERNNSRRTHPCILPYEELSEENKEKDRKVVSHWKDI